MTIEELYAEAVRLGRTDWTITVYDYYGDSRTATEIEWEVKDQEVFIA